MATITVNEDELKEIVEDEIVKVLSSKEGLLEILEDIAFGKAIEEGLGSSNVDTKSFMKWLHKKVKE